MADLPDLAKLVKSAIVKAANIGAPPKTPLHHAPILNPQMRAGHFSLNSFDPAAQIFAGSQCPMTVIVQVFGGGNIGGGFVHLNVSSDETALNGARDFVTIDNRAFLDCGIDFLQFYTVGGHPVPSILTLK